MAHGRFQVCRINKDIERIQCCNYCVYRNELVRESRAIVSKYNEDSRDSTGAGQYGLSQSQVIYTRLGINERSVSQPIADCLHNR
ncbi:MAG: hypothetical protein ACI94Z_002482 [Yoonia sp.]|jgi:hypothetical protein